MTVQTPTPPRYMLPLTEHQRSILERALGADYNAYPDAWHPFEDGRPCVAAALAMTVLELPNTQKPMSMTEEAMHTQNFSTILEPVAVIIMEESTLHSALRDLLSVILYTGCAALGYALGSQVLAAAGMIMCTLAMVLWISNIRKRYTIDEARNLLDKIEADQLRYRP